MQRNVDWFSATAETKITAACAGMTGSEASSNLICAVPKGTKCNGTLPKGTQSSGTLG